LIHDVSALDNEINNTLNDMRSYLTINVAGLNCRGLLHKVDSLLLSAALPHNAWHIICLQETHEAAYFNPQNLLLRHGWKYYSSRYIDNDNDDSLLHPTRGTAMYVHDSLSKQWKFIQHNTDTDLITWITMTNTYKRLHILSVYLPDTSKPPQDRQLAYDMLADTVTSISEDDAVCIQGDFNASIVAQNGNTQMLNNLIEQTGLHIMPNEMPTYIAPLSSNH
jgi:exonuclease III